MSATISEASSTVRDESWAMTCVTMFTMIWRRRILRLSSFNSSGDCAGCWCAALSGRGSWDGVG